MGKNKKKGGGGGKNKQKKGAGGGGVENKKNSPAVRKKASSGPYPVSGLMNLGNTCFFNSVMQSIGQTDYLRHRLNALVEGLQQQRLTLQVEQQQLDVVVTGKPGQLTKTLHAFMKDIATPTGRTLNPRPIFSQICEKAPRFRSYQQQDSQELLRYLLDALKTEEIQRMRQGILAVFKVSSGKKAALGHLSPSDKDTIKKFGNAVYGEPTYVDEVFGGVLFSTITCAECHSCSIIHENYLDLSLPVPRDQTGRGGGEGSHWSRGHRREKAQKSSEQPVEADIQRDVGVERGEEMVEGSKAAPPSKHQMKKAKKKTRKGGKVKQSFQDLQNMLNEADEEREGGEREVDEGGEEGEKREETKDEGEVGEEGGEGEKREDGEEGGGKGVGSDAQETTAGEAEPAEKSEEPENEGADIESETPVSAATEELQGGLCSNPETTPLPPAVSESNKAVEDATQPNTMPAVQDDEHNNERVQPTHAADQFPVENVDAVETTEDASPRQPEEATTPSNEYSSQTTNDASPRQPEATPLSSEDAAPPQPEKATPPPILNENAREENTATPTRNRTLTSDQFREDSLEGCLKKFCSVEILTGVNQFCCEVCTRQRASEISAAVRERGAARPLSRANSETRERIVQQTDESGPRDLEIRGKELSADSEPALLPLAEKSNPISSESRREADIREGNLQLADESRARDSPGCDKTQEPSPDSELAVSELMREQVKNSSESMEKEDGSRATDCSVAQQPVDSELALSVPELAGEQVQQLPESRGEDCQAEMACKCSQRTVSDSLTRSCTRFSRDGALCNGHTAQPESVESGVVQKTPAEGGEEEEEGENGDGEEREEKGEEGEKVNLWRVEGEERGNGKDTLGGGSGDRGGSSEAGDYSRSSSCCESTRESGSESDTAVDSTPELTPERKVTEVDKEEEPVFRDATKQLLIKSLPPVFTLHMKRFLQDGRRLRKNGRHIDFPEILDVAPFCIPDCEAPRDDHGRTLYCLYAVVEHSGGMQGGHYTAYVKVRDSHAPFTPVGGASDQFVSPTRRRDAMVAATSPTIAMATVGACTTNATTDDQRSAISTTSSTTTDHPTTDNNHAEQKQDHDTVNCSLNNTSTGEATFEQSHTAEDQIGTTNGTKTQPNGAKTQPNRTSGSFDDSSTGGQWYHISDTHVRTATQTEVHKCQAYLLFYERLPLFNYTPENV